MQLFRTLNRLVGEAAGYAAAAEGENMENLPKLDARVRPYQDPSDRPTKLMAFAELIIADAFVIKGIRVLKKTDGENDPFVVFPAEKGKGATADRWFDLAHPVTAEARNAAIGLILDKFRQVTGTPAAAPVPF